LALLLFIKISVPAVSVVRAVRGRFFVCVSLSFGGVCSRRQAVAVAPDQRRSHSTITSKNTRRGHFFALTQKSRKAEKVVMASQVAPKLTVNVVLIPCVRAFFGVGVGRAHLRIPPECRTLEPYTTCGFEGSLAAQKRGNP
jgi:hypothetical protein